MEEAQLLRDSIKQLDELFLLVVLGEFNSGEDFSAAHGFAVLQMVLCKGVRRVCCAVLQTH